MHNIFVTNNNIYIFRKVLFNEHIENNIPPWVGDRPGGYHWGADEAENVGAQVADAGAGDGNDVNQR